MKTLFKVPIDWLRGNRAPMNSYLQRFNLQLCVLDDRYQVDRFV